MVAMLEIAFLIVVVGLGSWWFSRTSIFRAHLRSGADPRGKRDDIGTSGVEFRLRPPPIRRYDDK